jgi:hypothetical protein
MPRLLYGVGAHTGIVSDIQRALSAANFDPKGVDGMYGGNTAGAVKAFQQTHGLSPTGMVDDVTWQALMKKAIPGSDVRCLELTAAFEGHGYTLAQGNWDGAWLTWGIIGFTLKHGEVQKIVLEIARSSPDLIRKAFGENAEKLIAIMNDRPRNQEQWADSLSASGGRLAEPWRTGFALLGQFPEVQEAQRQFAHTDYFVPAVSTARDLKLGSELGLALCFDIHVQNGSISPSAREDIQTALAAKPPSSERELREIIANAVAENSALRFVEDVRQRKLTIARGSGMVHGARFVLANWGLSEDPAREVA